MRLDVVLVAPVQVHAAGAEVVEPKPSAFRERREHVPLNGGDVFLHVAAV